MFRAILRLSFPFLQSFLKFLDLLTLSSFFTTRFELKTAHLSKIIRPRASDAQFSAEFWLKIWIFSRNFMCGLRAFLLKAKNLLSNSKTNKLDLFSYVHVICVNLLGNVSHIIKLWKFSKREKKLFHFSIEENLSFEILKTCEFLLKQYVKPKIKVLSYFSTEKQVLKLLKDT